MPRPTAFDVLISGSSEREIVDLQQGDYEEMDSWLSPSPSARRLSACCMPQTSASAWRARSARGVRSFRRCYLDLPAKLFSQVMDAAAGQKSLVKVIDAAPAQIPAPARSSGRSMS